MSKRKYCTIVFVKIIDAKLKEIKYFSSKQSLIQTLRLRNHINPTKIQNTVSKLVHNKLPNVKQ